MDNQEQLYTIVNGSPEIVQQAGFRDSWTLLEDKTSETPGGVFNIGCKQQLVNFEEPNQELNKKCLKLKTTTQWFPNLPKLWGFVPVFSGFSVAFQAPVSWFSTGCNPWTCTKVPRGYGSNLSFITGCSLWTVFRQLILFTQSAMYLPSWNSTKPRTMSEQNWENAGVLLGWGNQPR